MDVIPGSGGIGNAPSVSNRSFSGIGASLEASGASTPSDGGGNLRGQVRRQDSYGSVASGGGGGSGTGGSTAGAVSESKQHGGEVGPRRPTTAASCGLWLLQPRGSFAISSFRARGRKVAISNRTIVFRV